jgi:hypothetical protein
MRTNKPLLVKMLFYCRENMCFISAFWQKAVMNSNSSRSATAFSKKAGEKYLLGGENRMVIHLAADG